MTWNKVAAILFGGILLAIGGCGMYLTFFGSRGMVLGGLMFCAGAALTVIGLALFSQAKR